MQAPDSGRRRSARARERPARPDGRAARTPGRAAAESDSEISMRKLLRALEGVRDGDLSVRLPSDQTGLAGKVADTCNEIVISNQRLARELERAGQIVGKDGRT